MNTIIPFEKDYYFYINFKYTLLTDGEVNISSVFLNANYFEDSEYKLPVDLYLDIERGTEHYPIKDFSFSLDIYNQAESINLNKDLSTISNLILGHTVSYFKADPDYESRDALLKEWGLLKYRNPKYIKLVVPGNEFPENTMNINVFDGINFELPFEIHIDKMLYEQYFGYNQRPQSDDAIFFDRSDRMYLIDSSEAVRSFMNEIVYWKCNLVKFEKKSYISYDEDVTKIISDSTTNFDEMLGGDIVEQSLDATNKVQLESKTERYDMIRTYSYENYNRVIRKNDLNNYDITIAKYFYDLKNVYDEIGYSDFVQYKVNDRFLENSNRVYSSWFYLPENKIIEKEIKEITFIEDLKFKIEFKYGVPNVIDGDFIKIFKSGFEIYGKVSNITKTNFEQSLELEFENSTYIDYINSNFTGWMSYTDLYSYKIFEYNLLSNMNIGNEGISISIFENDKIKLNYNNKIKYFNLSYEIDKSKWYGMIFKMLNEFNQFTVYLYEIDDDTNNSELKLSHTQTFDYRIPEEILNTDYFYIKSSPILLTNVRYLIQNLTEEKHSKFLNQYIIDNSSKAIIIDNAQPRLRLPNAY